MRPPARLTRIVQLGVLVGFVVVAPKFDPTNQRAETMRAMCTYAMDWKSVKFTVSCLDAHGRSHHPVHLASVPGGRVRLHGVAPTKIQEDPMAHEPAGGHSPRRLDSLSQRCLSLPRQQEEPHLHDVVYYFRTRGRCQRHPLHLLARPGPQQDTFEEALGATDSHDLGRRYRSAGKGRRRHRQASGGLG